MNNDSFIKTNTVVSENNDEHLTNLLCWQYFFIEIFILIAWFLSHVNFFKSNDVVFGASPMAFPCFLYLHHRQSENEMIFYFIRNRLQIKILEDTWYCKKFYIKTTLPSHKLTSFSSIFITDAWMIWAI